MCRVTPSAVVCRDGFRRSADTCATQDSDETFQIAAGDRSQFFSKALPRDTRDGGTSHNTTQSHPSLPRASASQQPIRSCPERGVAENVARVSAEEKFLGGIVVIIIAVIRPTDHRHHHLAIFPNLRVPDGRL